jgi:hypothetical protein
MAYAMQIRQTDDLEAVAPDVRGLKVGDRAAYAVPRQADRLRSRMPLKAHKSLDARATSVSTILTI